MIWILFSAACSTGDSARESATPDGCTSEECALDACVTGGDTTEMRECCIASHGRGGLAGADSEALAASCSGEYCDEYRYLSEASARCVAQVHGLGTGIAECSARFAAQDTSGMEFTWMVWNVIDRACIDGEWGMGSGETVTLDAATGEFISSGYYSD